MALLPANLPLYSFCSPAPHPSTKIPLSSFVSRSAKAAFYNYEPLRILCAKRTGKRRYPSEKKKLQKLQKELLVDEIKNRKEGFWRLSELGVPVSEDPGKDSHEVSLPLLQAIAKVIEFPVASMLPMAAFIVVRKSFDARKSLKEAEFVYIVDMDVEKLLELEPRTWDFIDSLKPKLGRLEYMSQRKVIPDLMSVIHNVKQAQSVNASSNQLKEPNGPMKCSKPNVAIIGSGPSGLFAALVLAEFGANVSLIERGQAVEQRGRDIGALVVRRILQPESNFCFGEGGAGTWSDGKLVTSIGRNSDSVQAVMNTLVHFGAPPSILIDGKPHLGTDRLAPLLRNFRKHLQKLGVDIKFGTRLDDLIVANAEVTGIKICDVQNASDSKELSHDAVILAVGHSARDVYDMLRQHNVEMIPKDFAVGLRVEHPQELINSIQYSTLASEVHGGQGKVPVADYKIVKHVSEEKTIENASIRGHRSCYSFCMCPGGQVVLTSTDPSEICINGMSFSRRASRWANAALVVTVSREDFDAFQNYGPISGVEFQRECERKASSMGGGNFVVPAQTVTDFLEDRLTVTCLPPSSYRLGVKASKLHELYPVQITKALQQAILLFDRELPGFVSQSALLHGVETRTSSPIQILRHGETYESNSHKRLYPIGEGAGYAGGIVSAAVDGLNCGFAVAKKLDLYDGEIDLILGNTQKNIGFVKY